MIHDVLITIQGFSFSIDFFVSDLHGFDLVLGVVWLATLGPSTTDYVKRLFEFNISRQCICWLGNPVSFPTQINMTTLRHFTQTDVISYLLRLDLHSTSTTTLPGYPQDLCLLLQSYDDVFKSSKSLPPSRPRDHRIPLLPGANPINVLPYRYPYF